MGSSDATYTPWIKFWFWLALAPLSIVVGLYIAYIGIHDLGGREIYSKLPSSLLSVASFEDYHRASSLQASPEEVVFCKTSLDREELIQKIHEMGLAEFKNDRRIILLWDWKEYKKFSLGSTPKGDYYLVVPETWGYKFAILVL